MSLFIIVFFVIILFSFLLFSLKNKFEKNIPPIDIVYTWVEMTPEFISEKNKYLKNETPDGTTNNRYESHDELKYSLRSLLNFPHYRNIYIVVKDGQYPKFLKENKRLKIINHSQIIPEKYLPTFNACTIEAYLHYIPNLSDNYIFFNDDLMILKPLSKNFFLSPKTGKPLIITSSRKCNKKIQGFLNHSNEPYSFKNSWKISNNLLDMFKYEESRYYVSHVPKIYNKKYDLQIEKIFSNFYIDNQHVNLYDLQSTYKFRNNTHLYLNVILKPYLYNYLFNCDFKMVSETYKILNNEFKLDNIHDKQFLCVADHDNQNKSDLTSYYTYMEKLFPYKSEYEI